MTYEQKKKHLAKMNFARAYLYLNKMLTEKQNNEVHSKILKYQDKEKIEISEDDLHSVDFTFEKPNPDDLSLPEEEGDELFNDKK